MEKLKIIELDETNICKICENKLSKYTCPKCNILYCTVTCYKSEKHLQCSETFYRDCVMEEIKSDSCNSVSQQKMVEILKRCNEELNCNETELKDNSEVDSDDDDEVPDLAKRLVNIDLNDAESVWKLLTGDERQEFEALVSSTDLTNFLLLWKPWWEFQLNTKFVQVLTEEASQTDYQKNCPSILQNIPKYDQIAKRQAAEAVKYNLLNVIGAYTCIVRYFNGEHIEFAKEAVFLITSLSKNLDSNVSFESYTLALESIYQYALINEWIIVDAVTKIRMYQDVENIIAGPKNDKKTYYLKCALSDLHKLLVLSKKVKRKSVYQDNDFFKKFQDCEIPNNKIVTKQKVNLCVKKIEYYLSYVFSLKCILFNK